LALWHASSFFASPKNSHNKLRLVSKHLKPNSCKHFQLGLFFYRFWKSSDFKIFGFNFFSSFKFFEIFYKYLQNFPKLNQGKENQKKSERKNWN
jgi:hypothetical protein